jgi:hypothetical protein
MGHHHDKHGRTKPPKIRRMHENDLLAIMSAILMAGAGTGAGAPKDAAGAVASARGLLRQVKDSKPAEAVVADDDSEK